MADPAALTDEELAEMERDRDRALAINNPVGTSFVIIARYVPRLIAALRASRAEVERLRERLESPPGPESACEGPCCR